jgi:hypothetical protein
MPFDNVAQTVGRTAQACRQLATRGRQKISARDGGPASSMSPPPSTAWSPRSSSPLPRTAAASVTAPAARGCCWPT